MNSIYFAECPLEKYYFPYTEKCFKALDRSCAYDRQLHIYYLRTKLIGGNDYLSENTVFRKHPSNIKTRIYLYADEMVSHNYIHVNFLYIDVGERCLKQSF